MNKLVRRAAGSAPSVQAISSVDECGGKAGLASSARFPACKPLMSALLGSCILPFAAFSQPAMAQEAGQSNASDSGSHASIEEIVVTAQRREETVQKAAIPINVATGSQLIAAGVSDATALNKIAPALNVNNGGGANTAFFVRGVGNFTNNGFTAPAIAFNIDGVYIGRPSSTISALLDLNRIEVLKGPQGTLYGRNATGGAINVIPNLPKLGDTSGSLAAGYGNYDAYEVTGVVNLPVGDRSAFRVAGVVSGHDGYFRDGTGNARDFAMRAQFLTELSDTVTVRLAGDYSTQGGTGAGVAIDGFYSLAPFQSQLPVPNWAFTKFNVDPFAGLHDPAVQNLIVGKAQHQPLRSNDGGFAYPSRNDSYWGLNAEINVDLGGAKLVFIPAYRRSKLDNVFNGPPFKAAINKDIAEQYSFETRLSGSVGQLDYIVGGYYFKETVDGRNSFNQFSTTSYNVFRSVTDSKAAFGRLTWHATPSLRFVGALRYTDEGRSFDARTVSLAAVCLADFGGPAPCARTSTPIPSIPVGLTIGDSLRQYPSSLFIGRPANAYIAAVDSAANGVPNVTIFGGFGPTNRAIPPRIGPLAILSATPTVIDRSAADKKVTYRLAAEYNLTPDNLLYASFETGFRAGGFNLSFGNEEFAPEFIDAYTIGSKNSFAGGSLIINLEGFYWRYKGQQLAALGLDGRGANSFFTTNVGNSSIYGLEADMQWAVTRKTILRSTVQYLHATYDDYSYTQVDLADETKDPPRFLTPITTCKNTQIGYDGNPATRAQYVIDCSGRDALNAPRWTITGGIEQTAELGRLKLIGTFDGRYRSSRELGFNYVPGGRAPGVLTLDASLTLRPDTANWFVTGYVRNLTDRVIRATYQLGAGNIAGSALEPPRTYGVRIGYNF